MESKPSLRCASKGKGFFFVLAAAVFLGLLTCSSEGATYYVSPTGNDASVGSLALPWKTIQKAADSLSAGDTVFVRAGTYKKVTVNISGSAGSPITFANYPGETPIIDGTGTVPPSDDTGLFLLTDQSYITIQGFELRNYKTANVALAPAGVFLRGACQHVTISGCNIHDIWNTGGNVANPGNAFGVVVYASSATAATGLVITDNEIHHLKTGSSESLVLNGNVTNFQVTNNTVHDNNNIGIDFVGFEGTAPSAALDQARDGVCSGNLVYNITSQGNQAYAAGSYSTDGIYCDGSTRIVIENNIVHHTDIGIELASEHAGKLTSAITVRNNFVYSNRQTGLFLGGYAQSGTGGTDGCKITGNTFYKNDTLHWDNGEAQLRFRTSNCVIRGNIFYALPNNWMITVPVAAGDNINNTFNYNLYNNDAGTNAALWSWNNQQRTGFAAWKGAANQDANSLFGDPKFVNATTPDLHLQSTSPAINAGDPNYMVASGETDVDFESRVIAGRIDIGADEVASIDPNVTITSNAPPSPIAINTPFQFSFTANGFPAPGFSLLSGSFPPGLSIAANGVLQGTPTQTGSFSGTVRASNGVGTSATQNFTITVAAAVPTVVQTIAKFRLIPAKIFGQIPFKIIPPLASSKLPVTVTVVSGPAKIANNLVTITGAGTVTLAANQPGNGTYKPAAQVTTSFVVKPKAQTIARFAIIPAHYANDPSFNITIPAASSGLPVTVAVMSGPATISGTNITLTGVGRVTLAATQSGNANYAAAKTQTTFFLVRAPKP